MADITRFPRGVPHREVREQIAPAASWADPAFIADQPHWRYTEGKIFLGASAGRAIGVRDNRHMMTIAGNRSGKGTSVLIPNLCLYPGSTVTLDTKGELFSITGKRRGAGSDAGGPGLGHHVYPLAPYASETAASNPLDMIDPDSLTAVDDAALLLEAIVMMESGDGRHFSAAARNFGRGVVLHICTTASPEDRNLLYMRELITLDSEGFALLLAAMVENQACDGVIRRAANSMIAKENRERSGVISTLIEQTDFLDSPAMARVLKRSDFRLEDLKRKPMSVYLCLPASRMETHNRWLRIMINMTLKAMEDEKTKPPLPVILMMDEFPVLGHMESLEKAAGQIAGFDCLLWPVIQDLSQLKAVYKERWETFMGNAGLLQFFANNDATTLEYIARRLGKTTIQQISQSEISDQQAAGGFTGESVSAQVCELMTSEEVGRFFSRQQETQLILWPGANPIALDRIEYYRSDFFKGLYDPR